MVQSHVCTCSPTIAQVRQTSLIDLLISVTWQKPRIRLIIRQSHFLTKGPIKQLASCLQQVRKRHTCLALALSHAVTMPFRAKRPQRRGAACVRAIGLFESCVGILYSCSVGASYIWARGCGEAYRRWARRSYDERDRNNDGVI